MRKGNPLIVIVKDTYAFFHKKKKNYAPFFKGHAIHVVCSVEVGSGGQRLDLGLWEITKWHCMILTMVGWTVWWGRTCC